jgi:hypothetical protein
MSTTAPPPRREDSVEVVTAMANLLLDFSSGQSFLLTSDSLAVLVKGLAPRLIEAAAVGRSVDLLRHWGRLLEDRRPQLMEHASREAASVALSRAPLFTDDVARVALQLCPPDPDF